MRLLELSADTALPDMTLGAAESDFYLFTVSNFCNLRSCLTSIIFDTSAPPTMVTRESFSCSVFQNKFHSVWISVIKRKYSFRKRWSPDIGGEYLETGKTSPALAWAPQTFLFPLVWTFLLVLPHLRGKPLLYPLKHPTSLDFSVLTVLGVKGS